MSIFLNDIQQTELSRVLDIINKGEMKRMGTLFNTNQNNYFYDTGTGKVVLLDDEAFYIISLWFKSKDITLEEFLDIKYLNVDSLLELLDLCVSENLFSAEKPKSLYSPDHFENLQTSIESNLQQLVLEVTGKCNLRCGYCIYNEQYESNRNFNSNNMTIETAKKAIDYFFNHARNKLAITFYGGEPLLNFEIVKWSIDYSLEKNIHYKKELTFSLTTNMTLVTDEIAEYLGSIPGLSILCSMDGPELVHDAYRKYANKEGSFSNAMRGLKLLAASFKRYDKSFSINAVCAPPYTYDKFDKINVFFSKLDFLPKGVTVKIGYPTNGSVDNKESIQKMEQNPKYSSSNYSDIDPLLKWQILNLKNTSTNKSPITPIYDQILKRIDARYISNKPNNLYPFNGCCVPGKRKLYVDTEGNFYPCERIGTSPSIGNIATGIEYEKIKKYYVDDYVNKIIGKCSNCWAIRMCHACYIGIYDENGVKESEVSCDGVRRSLEKYLSLYHELLEENQGNLDFLREMNLS